MNLTEETRQELRIEFAKIALAQLASNVLETNFQRAAKDAEVDADELVSVYCWQIADSMIKYM
jgi:hypothetical protein